MRIRRTVVAVLLAVGVAVGTAGPAGASRASSLCGGIGNVQHSTTGLCVAG